jgi:LacI family transcriptional regulator
MPTTIKDVAREAGVSVTTAHRALNGKSELGAEKRERVLEAARQLNYVPSAAARTLVSGRSRTLGMIVTNNASPVYADIVRGVEAVARDAGYGLLLCNSDDDQSRALECLEILRAKQVDGVLITPVQSDRRDIDYLSDSHIPYVLLLRYFDDPADDRVIIDNEAAAYGTSRYLLELGHRQVGCIAGPQETSSGRARLAGFQRAVREGSYGIRADFVTGHAFTVEGGYQGAIALLSGDVKPTAIVAANDLQAVGVIKAARERGLTVPDDLALVGGDNIELAEFLDPPLTTFDQPALAIGRRGAEILLDRLDGDERPPHHVTFVPDLIVRASSGGPM